MGEIYVKNEDYEKALECFDKSLEIAEKFKDKAHKCYTYSCIADVYIAKREYDKANDYVNNSLKISGKSRLTREMADGFQKQGIIYEKTGKLKDSIRNYALARMMFEKLNDRINIAKSIKNIGNLYKKINNIGKAKEYFNIALEHFQELGAEKDIEEVNTLLKNLTS